GEDSLWEGSGGKTERDSRPTADPSRVARPAAGKDSTRPSDLRPPAVLLKTVCFLIDDISTSPTLQPWTDVYDFFFDWLRSVRQDIIQRMFSLYHKAHNGAARADPLHPAVCLTLSVSRSFMDRNHSCALRRHLEACRIDLLLLHSHSHSSKNCSFPLHKMAYILALDVPPNTQLCQAHGVDVKGDSVVFSKTFIEIEAGL
ncbi:unnamed protein product, partial [Coregonus sp. 'balchen']